MQQGLGAPEVVPVDGGVVLDQLEIVSDHDLNLIQF
jgi:hypothetical protein